jgi:peptidoglycan hydrolase-like protein with peptidoglycan-binding domain
MMKNPKTRLGLIALAVLLVLGGVLAGRMIPTIRETRREMSLTPTPLPPVPDSVMAVTPDPARPTAEPMLRTGSRGQDVTDLQSRLAALGYYDKDQIDGAFGTGTKEAVIAFQKANGLDADGVAGAETKEVLFSPNAVPYTAPKE